MPQDPDLYGRRPAKKQKRGATLSTSLDFSAQLTQLLASAGSAKPSSKRTKPTEDGKGNTIRGSKKQNERSAAEAKAKSRLVLKEVAGTEEEAQKLARAKRRLKDKARRYAAMRRGDYVAQENEAEPLVDFDRKWAEEVERREGLVSETSSGDEAEGGEGQEEIVEWDDEFGRRRRGTRAEQEKMQRRSRRGVLGAEELERMSARPAAPKRLIYGDAIQSMAFYPDNAEKMEELARKRDRRMTPPEMKHYDADAEIRSKGVGFYKFSKDEEARTREMRALEAERRRTEEERQAREGQKSARRREVEERRREMEARRARRQADSFLDGLADEAAAG